jgi:hypothetical protein
MKKIQVFLDDISTLWDNSLREDSIQRKRVPNTNEPFFSLNLFGVTWEFYIYGQNNTNMLPQCIKEASYNGCRPDLWFYDPILDKILLGIEETSTAPVGNAQKQRIPRPLWAIENGVPFIYVSPSTGMDNSQKQKRKQTGVLKQMVIKNPKSFISKENYNLKKLMLQISVNDLDQYLLKSPFTLDSLKKTKVSLKSLNDQFLKVKKLIDGDEQVVNVIEENGNIYLVPKNSRTAKHFGFDSDTILIIGMGWKSSKKSKGFSDPFSGSVLMVYYINKWFGDLYSLVVISTHDCKKYNTSTLVKGTNKMTFALSKVQKLIDLCGHTYHVQYNKMEIFKYKGDDESIATYCRYSELRKENVEIEFIQPPHGSWSSSDGLNTTKRDIKRADIYHVNAQNGEEGKTKLSDVYKHIEKYGLVHDKYYYLIEDVELLKQYQDRIHKVTY